MKTEQRRWSLTGNRQTFNPASRAAGPRESTGSGAADLPESGADLYRFPLCCAADEPAIGNLLSLSFEPSSYSGVTDLPLPETPSADLVSVVDDSADEGKPAPGETPPSPAIDVLPAVPAEIPEAPLFGQAAADERAGRNPWVLVLIAALAVLAALILYYALRRPADGAAVPDEGVYFVATNGQQGPRVEYPLGPRCRPALGRAESHGQA